MSPQGEPMTPYALISLHISEEVERLLEERMILREDLQQVIHYAETTARKLINTATGLSLACFRPKAVFFWVAYRKEGEGWRVDTAYSHRMVMKSSGSTKEWVKSGGSSNWLCNQCQALLEVQTVRLQYMQSIFTIDLPACSQCGLILVAEELATGKIAEAEQALEDK